MPLEHNDAMSDGACIDLTEQEAQPSGLSRFQVGTSTRNNASEDGDTGASFIDGTHAAADDLNAGSGTTSSAGAPDPAPSSESNNSTSARAAEAEDDEHTQSQVNGHAARGAHCIVANEKDDEEETYVHTEVATAAAGEEGQTNEDDNATDVVVVPSTRGDASAATSLPSDDGSVHVDATDFNNRTAAAIRRSIHETPGAFHVIPRNPTNVPRGEGGAAEEEISVPETSTTVHSGSNNNDTRFFYQETEQEGTPSSDTISQSRRRSTATSSNNGPTQFTTHPPIELAEAWVVEEGEASRPSAALPPNQSTHFTSQSDTSSASPAINASVEPAIVTITATRVKERSWFKTPTGIILSILLLGCIVALAVAIPARRKASNAAAASRPFEIVIPSMPKDVSDMLEFKYNKVLKAQPIAMAFSADLSVHASSRIDEYYGKLQVVQYNSTSSSWEIVAKYGKEEAREKDEKDGQYGNSAGDLFGAWADMSYDGRILAVGLPRDDPWNIPDAGSVRVMVMESNDDILQTRWNLKGYGNYIAGVDPYGWTGTTFSLIADGSMIAVASPLASKGRGVISVYNFEKNETIADGGAWVQMGQAIVGDTFGSVLSFAKLSKDGSMLATGSMKHGNDSGQLRIFLWDNDIKLWVQMGSAIEGNVEARLGVFPQFSRDGLTVAFSQAGEPYRCHVYRWDEVNKDWGKIDNGEVFQDGYVCMDLSPDGKKVILCSTDEKRCTLVSFRSREWHETQEFLIEAHGFLPYLFEREGEGDTIGGFVAPIGNEEGYTIGFFNIN